MAKPSGNPHPDNPIAGRWKPGQSGNPKGRPPKKILTEALQRVLAKLNDKETETLVSPYMERIARGDVAAFKEVADRTEGRVPQSVGGSTTLGPVKLKVEWSE